MKLSNKIIKYKILKLLNTGVVNAKYFSDVKNMQLYNTFIFFSMIIVIIYVFLLFVFSFYISAIVTGIGFFALPVALYLNSKNQFYYSKFFIMQFVLAVFFCCLLIFSVQTIANFYFFIAILYASILFTEKETKTKYFFITESLVMLFILLTTYKNYFPILELCPRDKLNDINIIFTIVFILFLFLYIFFQTRFQTYKENRYYNQNTILKSNNIKIRIQNIQKKLSISITTNLLNHYLNTYQNLFEKFTIEKDAHLKELNFIELQSLNANIETIIDYQFSRVNSNTYLHLLPFEIHQVTQEIAKQNNIEIAIKLKNEIHIMLHYDLYQFFIIEIMKKFNPQKRKVHLTILSQKNPIFNTLNSNKMVTIMGIQISYRYEKSGIVYVTLNFVSNTDSIAIFSIN